MGCQKLGIILENKVFQKCQLQKTSKKLIFVGEKSSNYWESITLALGDMAEITTSSMCPLRLVEDVGVLYTILGAWSQVQITHAHMHKLPIVNGL